MSPLIRTPEQAQSSVLSSSFRQDATTGGLTKKINPWISVLICLIVLFILFKWIRRKGHNRRRRERELLHNHHIPRHFYVRRPPSTSSPSSHVASLSQFTEEDIDLARARRGEYMNDLSMPPTSALRKAKRARLLIGKLSNHEYDGDDLNATCPICLDELILHAVTNGKCGHVMHMTCLKNWLAKDKELSCPVCRSRIRPDDDD